VGISDPMARVYIGGTEVCQTRVIDNCLDPKWNEVYHLIIYKSTLSQIENGSDIFKVDVAHSSPLGPKSLGTTLSLSLSNWIQLLGVKEEKGEEREGRRGLSVEEEDELLLDWGSPFNDNGSVWKKLAANGKAVGSIKIGMCYFPMVPPAIPVPPSAGDADIVTPPMKSVSGIVTVTIHQAKELHVGENSSVECSIFSDLKELFKTQARKRTANPSWESKHMFYSSNVTKEQVRLVVFNKGRSIGEVKIKINDSMNQVEDWYKLFGSGTGKLRVSFRFSPVDVKQSTADKRKANRLQPIGILKVSVKEAKNLASVDFMGKSDPYVKVFLAGRTVGVTNVQEDTLCPIWNVSFYTVAYSLKETITFDVFDWNNLSKDRPLGKIHLPLGALMAHITGSLSASESNGLAEFEFDGLKISVQDKTVLVCAPLYFKTEKVEEEKQKVGDQLEPRVVPTKSTMLFTKGITNLTSEIKNKKVKQKGHIYFELTLFDVMTENIIEPLDEDENERNVIPGISIKDEDRKDTDTDALQIVTKKRNNADIVNNCSTDCLIRIWNCTYKSLQCILYTQMQTIFSNPCK
jgi:hypothetical protein